LISALVVDGETAGAALMRCQLESQGVVIYGEAESESRAVHMAERLNPDLITVDLPTLGQDIAQVSAALVNLRRPPLLVFVSGHTEYAADAFECDALDYLVKPVAPERLAKTLVRARKRLAVSGTNEPVASEPLRMLPVRGDYLVRLVKVEDILFATARDKRVFACTADGEYRLRHTLAQLERMLPGDRFLRIHDSWLVNLDRVEELLFLGNHSYKLRLENKVQAPIGRTHYAELQRRLGLAPALV